MSKKQVMHKFWCKFDEEDKHSPYYNNKDGIARCGHYAKKENLTEVDKDVTCCECAKVKIHLNGEDPPWQPACSSTAGENRQTKKVEEVTCKSCKKTKHFKRLSQL